MCLLPQDRRHLSHALEIAAAAAAFASPNPAVGCVLTRNGEAFAEGAHRYDQRDHAEIVALKQAAARSQPTRGATAYVTLEPCSHHGRTGPCADALIAAGIGRCVVATADPNPQVSGTGLARLKAAGIDVCLAEPTHPLAQRARRLNDAFAFSIAHARPFVTLKAALSADGKLAPPPAARTATAPHWLTGPAARADVQGLRHASDAILTGIGTVLADNPSLTDRTGLPRRRPLLRVVLDSHLRTPLHSTLVTSAANDVLLCCTAAASPQQEHTLRAAGVDILRLDGPSLVPKKVLDALFATQIRSVLIEAGSTLNGGFLAAGLVDKLVLYYSETELGAGALPFAAGQPSPYILQGQLLRPSRAAFAHGTAAGGTAEDVRIAGYLHDPWPATLFPRG